MINLFVFKYCFSKNCYLSDVAGYVTNVGRVNYTKTGAKNLDFYRANHRLEFIFFSKDVVN
jgi:hypothetical protein